MAFINVSLRLRTATLQLHHSRKKSVSKKKKKKEGVLNLHLHSQTNAEQHVSQLRKSPSCLTPDKLQTLSFSLSHTMLSHQGDIQQNLENPHKRNLKGLLEEKKRVPLKPNLEEQSVTWAYFYTVRVTFAVSKCSPFFKTPEKDPNKVGDISLKEKKYQGHQKNIILQD